MGVSREDSSPPLGIAFLLSVGLLGALTKQDTKKPLVASSSGEQRTNDKAWSGDKSKSKGVNRVITGMQLPGNSISSGNPRRCHFGRTWSGGASSKPPLFPSSELRAPRTTCSFSVACILHVEYTILETEGTTQVHAKPTPDVNLSIVMMLEEWRTHTS